MITKNQVNQDFNSLIDYYKIITDSAREHIFIINSSYEVEFVNQYAADKLGLSRQDVAGKKMEQFFPEDIASMQKEYLSEIFRNGENKQKISHSEIGGQEVWLDTILVPLPDNNGRVNKILGISRDITNRKKAEEELKESEEKYRILIENANDGIYIRDKDGTIEFVNDKLCGILGYKREELTGKRSWDFIHPDDFDRVQNKVDLNNLDDNFWQEGRVITKAGDVKCLDINTVPFVSSKGEKKVFGICRDITNKKETEEALKSSEENYKLLIEEQGEGIGITDANEVIRFANPAAERIFGVGKGGLVNKSLEEFTSPEEFIRLKKETQLRKKGKKSSYETEIICANGKRKTLHLTATPKYDINGNFEGTFGIFRDITSEKKIEEALKISEERFKRFTEITYEGIIIHKAGKILDVNPSVLKLFGYGEEEVLNKDIFDFILPKYHQVIKERLAEDYYGIYEFEAIKKDGTVFPVEVNVRSVTIEDETYRVVSLNDITRRKKAEEALKESEKALKEANITKDKFFSILAHDLRSPVSNLMQFSKLLEENFEELSVTEIKDYLRFISNLSGNTYNLLENLLTWSRIQLNKMSFDPVEFNLKGVVESVLQIFREAISSKNLTINLEVNNTLKPYANEKSIEVVIRNLISNAVKFTSTGGEIDIAAKVTDKEMKNANLIEFSVTDSGVGISEKHLKDLFSIDSVYSTEGTEKEKGTGLGLILCKEFVEKNGGTLSVESQAGKGSTFSFTIPCLS